MIKSDKTMAVILFLFSVIMFAYSITLPQVGTEIRMASAAFFPQVWAAILAILSVILFIKGKKSEKVNKEVLITRFSERKKIYYTIFLSLAYIILLNVLGYLISTFLFLLISVSILSEEKNIFKVSHILISLIATLFTYYFFSTIMNIYLPSGLFV